MESQYQHSFPLFCSQFPLQLLRNLILRFTGEKNYKVIHYSFFMRKDTKSFII
jgi:hypothetical protein